MLFDKPELFGEVGLQKIIDQADDCGLTHLFRQVCDYIVDGIHKAL